MGLATAAMVAGGGVYVLDTILDFLRQGETGKGELALQKLILEGQRQQTETMAVRGRKEEVRTERLMQQAMQMRRKEQRDANMMQLLMMLQGFGQQKGNALSGFMSSINASRATMPVAGQVLRGGF